MVVKLEGCIQYQDGNVIVPAGGIILFVYHQVSHIPNLFISIFHLEVMLPSYGLNIRKLVDVTVKTVSCSQEEPRVDD